MIQNQFVVCSQGYPLKVYHGTTISFQYFRPLSHFGTKKAAQDILRKVRNVKEEVLRDKTDSETIAELDLHYNNKKNKENDFPLSHMDPAGYLIPAYLKIKHPIIIPDVGCHTVETYKKALVHFLLSKQWQTVVPLRHGCEIFNPLGDKGKKYPRFFGEICKKADFLPMIRFIFDEPLSLPIKRVRHELSLEKLYTPCQNETRDVAAEVDRYHLIFQRMIRFCESQGCDGFSYINREEDHGSQSYIIFRPNQVMRLDQLSMHVPDFTPSVENEAKLQKIMETSLSKNNCKVMDDREILEQIEYHFDAEYQMYKQVPDDSKSFWTAFALRYIMPAVQQVSQQPVWGYHGLEHTEQVVLFGIDYALATGTNPLPVILACALHDCARTTDKYNITHAVSAEPIAREFLKQHQFNLSPKETEQIISAIVHHTEGRNASNAIAACLWDADRTRLSWQYGYHPVFYATERGKEVAQYTPGQQHRYLQQQVKFLKQLNVPSLLAAKDHHIHNKKYDHQKLHLNGDRGR